MQFLCSQMSRSPIELEDIPNETAEALESYYDKLIRIFPDLTEKEKIFLTSPPNIK